MNNYQWGNQLFNRIIDWISTNCVLSNQIFIELLIDSVNFSLENWLRGTIFVPLQSKFKWNFDWLSQFFTRNWLRGTIFVPLQSKFKWNFDCVNQLFKENWLDCSHLCAIQSIILLNYWLNGGWNTICNDKIVVIWCYNHQFNQLFNRIIDWIAQIVCYPIKFSLNYWLTQSIFH